MSCPYPFRHAVVIGASSGIGEAIACQLARAGAQVALVARRRVLLEKIRERQADRMHIYAHDVTDYACVPDLLREIVKQLGGLDILVYSAGVMPTVREGEYDFSKQRQMVQVNLLGAMAWMEPVAARFEASGTGTIVGISSIAGERGRRANTGYCATKAGLSAYLEGLRNRCSRYGVNIVTIKPGYVHTAMTQGMARLPWAVSADYVARRTLRIARRGCGASCFVPRRWWLVAAILRRIPSWLFRRLSI